ncbi:large ribosomal subunit protein bL9m-like [Physella acuta]|uniref:large ribosomal subunit protein bL9m-like n=1 Tax=Physella acuta TaxID=109671 RepID=UPI0027DB34A7|nr:large ribosomal subunit protein bL9m-like [Physella acuta]
MALPVKVLSNAARVCPRLQPSLCLAACVTRQQTRNHTIVMERVIPIPPGKDGGLPNVRDMNELYKILRHVKTVYYPSQMSCILTDFVEGLGIRGDVVKVKRNMFHDQLFPAGLAVYASPQNLKEFEEERKALGIEKAETRLGVLARMTMKELNHMNLQIPMNENVEWVLTKEHVQVAFRTQGVEMLEQCIQLPEEEITTFQDLTVKVTINGLETVTVKATIVPISEKFVTPASKIGKLKK